MRGLLIVGNARKTLIPLTFHGVRIAAGSDALVAHADWEAVRLGGNNTPFAENVRNKSPAFLMTPCVTTVASNR